jgi:WD40 repeat protein
MESLHDSDPRVVGAYRLVARLGGGGMGRVYLGTSPGGRDVAVKVMHPELTGEPDFRARFRREVEAARLVGGFHTAAVVDADPEADPPWMVTEYIPGPSLKEKVASDGPLSPAALQDLAAGLAEGLSAIHARGLVHRDLTPANVIMTGNGPRIIDFGIARSAHASVVTSSGVVVGTAAFMSPEHVDSRPAGPASDIFSLGSVLAYAATGASPFAAGSPSATYYAILGKDPDLRAIPRPLRGVVASCLAKEAARRPTAEALLASIAEIKSLPFPGNPALRAAVVTPSLAPVRGRPLVPRTPQPRPRRADRPRPQVQVQPSRQGWRLVTADPDGRWLASADGDGTITAWQAGTGLPVRSWPAQARVRAMAAVPGGLLVAAGDDGRVRAWDVETGRPGAHIPAYIRGLSGRNARDVQDVPGSPGLPGARPARVRALAFDRSGGWMAASVDGVVRVWDVADPREPRVLASLPCVDEVSALAFDDTGWRLAAGDVDGKVAIWDLGEAMRGEPAGGLADASRVCDAALLALAWDDVGSRWLAAGADGSLAALGAAEGSGGATVAGAWLTAVGGGQLRAAALLPAGGTAAVIDDEQGRIHLVRLDDPARPRALDGTGLVVTGVAFAGPGVLIMGGSDGALRQWDTRARTMTTISAAGAPVTAVAASPDGTRLAASDQRPRVTAYGVAGDPPSAQWSAECAEPVAALAFTPDGAWLVTAGDAVRAWDAAEGAEIAALPSAAPPSAAPPSAALPVSARPAPARRARAVARDRAGRRVAAAWSDGVVSVWDGQVPLWERAGHQGAVLAVAFGPLPGQLVTAGDDETIRVWDAGTGSELACQSELGYRATALAASPAGGTLAIGCADGLVRLPGPGAAVSGRRTAPASWADLPVLAGHVHGITAMSFDVSGRWLATASRDGTARVWDLRTRLPMAVIVPAAAGPGPARPGAGSSGSRGWAAAVASPEGIWHGISEPGNSEHGASAAGRDDTGARIWLALGLARQPLPPVPGATANARASSSGKARRPSLRRRRQVDGLRAGRGDDRVGGEAGDQARQQADGQQVRATSLGGDAEQLDHDIKDGPRGQRQEDDAHRLAGVGVADRGADERRAAADQAQQQQEAPAWPGRGAGAIPAAGQRRDDAEAFGGVMQAEPDDQQRGQRQLAGGRRLADREALGEVMQADPGGDHQRQPPRRGPFRHPPGRRLRPRQRPRPEAALGGQRAGGRAHHPHLVGHQRPEPDRQPGGEQRAVAEDRRQATVGVMQVAQRGVDGLPGSREDVPHQEQQDPDRQRVQHCPHRRRRAPHPPDGQAEHDRPARDEPQQQRLGQTHDRTASLPVLPGTARRLGTALDGFRL